jgi:hypothetical protein
MSRRDPLRDPARPTADRINCLIRRLMGKPASRERTDEWQRLIVLWAEANRADVETIEEAA